jgi:hypothetical protein
MSESKREVGPEPVEAEAQPAVAPGAPAVAPSLEGALGGNAVMARRLASGRPSSQDAYALRAVAPYAGNAAVNRYVGGNVLARQGPGHAPAPPKGGRGKKPADAGQGNAPDITIGPAIWSWNLHPRARPVEAAHIERTTTRPDGGIAYKDDTMRLMVSVRGLTPANQGEHLAMMMNVGETQVDGMKPKFTGNGYEWNLRFAQMGRLHLSAMISGPNDLEEQWNMDLTSDLINADILSGGAGVNDAAAAYKAAYDAQKAVLDKEAKNRAMVEEMLWNALFAGIGGLAGGAVGARMGKALGEARDSLTGGAAIDGAKDVTKSRAAARLHQPVQLPPAVGSGDAARGRVPAAPGRSRQGHGREGRERAGDDAVLGGSVHVPRA